MFLQLASDLEVRIFLSLIYWFSGWIKPFWAFLFENSWNLGLWKMPAFFNPSIRLCKLKFKIKINPLVAKKIQILNPFDAQVYPNNKPKGWPDFQLGKNRIVFWSN
jgi:hypothetical protein